MRKKIFIYALSLVGLSSCLPFPDGLQEKELDSTSSEIEKAKVPETFDFKTSSVTTIKVKVLNGQDKPLNNIPFTIVTEPNGEVLLRAITNSSGLYEIQKELGNHIEMLSFKTDLIGIVGSVTIKIQNKEAQFVIGGTKPTTGIGQDNDTRLLRVADLGATTALPTLQTLGSWNSNGVPSYLEPVNDNISSSFLLDITSSLPEGGNPLPVSHPEYIQTNRPTTLYVKELADVWVTFVHEGAGYKNTLGFYTFNAQSPPTSSSQITNPTIIFPNVSYSGSGGGLVSGNKVKIGTFPAGTSIGFFLLSNAYSGTTVGSGQYPLFSHSNLNPETNTSINRHIVLLDDSKSNNILLSVEDVRRDNAGCDNDFNDAVFTVSSNPIVAIQDPNIPKMDTNVDTDGDGAGDTRDEFPTDPTRAFRSYTPSKTTFSTLVFEDLWPAKGDYDFNDMVLDYQIEEVYNTQNKIVEIFHRSVIKAVGASFKNGFGFQLNASPSLIKKVTGSVLKNNIVTLSANGTEAGQSKAVIIGFDNVFDNIKRVGSEFLNTVKNQPYSNADTLTLKIELNSPQTQSTIGVAPYNQFIFTDQTRGKEVHLANYPPTSLANQTLFGTAHDRSNPNFNYYYKNWTNLPWAIQVPTSFEYTVEKQEISNGYLNFRAWAESGGTLYSDWYLPKNGYRNTTNIFTK